MTTKKPRRAKAVLLPASAAAKRAMRRKIRDNEARRTRGDDEVRILASLSANVLHFRDEHGLTQEDLARLAGLNHNDLSRIENGRHLPRLDKLARVAKALGVSVDDLIQ